MLALGLSAASGGMRHASFSLRAAAITDHRQQMWIEPPFRVHLLTEQTTDTQLQADVLLVLPE